MQQLWGTGWALFAAQEAIGSILSHMSPVTLHWVHNSKIVYWALPPPNLIHRGGSPAMLATNKESVSRSGLEAIACRVSLRGHPQRQWRITPQARLESHKNLRAVRLIATNTERAWVIHSLALVRAVLAAGIPVLDQAGNALIHKSSAWANQSSSEWRGRDSPLDTN